jgi:hypothetical protein
MVDQTVRSIGQGAVVTLKLGAGPHLLPKKLAQDFPGQTFRVLKEKEERVYGEYRTGRLVPEAWEQRDSADSGKRES